MPSIIWELKRAHELRKLVARLKYDAMGPKDRQRLVNYIGELEDELDLLRTQLSRLENPHWDEDPWCPPADWDDCRLETGK